MPRFVAVTGLAYAAAVSVRNAPTLRNSLLENTASAITFPANEAGDRSVADMVRANAVDAFAIRLGAVRPAIVKKPTARVYGQWRR